MLPLALAENSHRRQPGLARPLLNRLHTASEWSHSTLTLRLTARARAHGSFGSSSNSPLAPRRTSSVARTAPFTKREEAREGSTVEADGAVGLARGHGADGVHPHGGERGGLLRGVDDLRGHRLDAQSSDERWGRRPLGVGGVPNTDGPQLVGRHEGGFVGAGELDAADGREVATRERRGAGLQGVDAARRVVQQVRHLVDLLVQRE